MDLDKNLYRLKAREMRAQAYRAETPFLGAMYRQMADEWELQAKSEEPRPQPEQGKPS
jgi:hypothetical protein